MFAAGGDPRRFVRYSPPEAMRTSRDRATAINQTGTAPRKPRVMMNAVMAILSARGSNTFPQSLTVLVALAMAPSTKSERIPTKRMMDAGIIALEARKKHAANPSGILERLIILGRLITGPLISHHHPHRRKILHCSASFPHVLLRHLLHRAGAQALRFCSVYPLIPSPWLRADHHAVL